MPTPLTALRRASLVVVAGLVAQMVAVNADAQPRHRASLSRDLAERIGRLLGDPEEARRLGEAGRRRAATEFGWRAIAERVEALYRHVLSSG